MLMNPRWKILVLFAALTSLFLLMRASSNNKYSTWLSKSKSSHSGHGVYRRPDCKANALHDGKTFHWSCVPTRYPVSPMKSLPSSYRWKKIPRIQAKAVEETASERETRLARLDAVKGNFTHAWTGYKSHAWLRDEVMPLSGRPHDPFGGWAATLVDSLDTLLIMGLHDEFQAAVKAIEVIDFSACALDDINVFETTIRYLGGFLAAYDLTGGQYPVLLQKAGEIGDMLYVAFDTPNRMPITRWNFRAAAAGTAQESSEHMLVAEIGSLTLEFTRLSQLTGDPRYFDAVQRIMDVFDKQQNRTNLPGMWPTVVNAKTGDFTSGTGFTIGGMVDSLYEYLPKQHLLLGGATDQYQKLFENALIAMKRNIFYRPMTPDGRSILLAGEVNSDGKTPVDQLKTEPQAQHLGCFAGGMVGIAAKIFESEEDLDVAKKLVEGCIWGYETFPNGIMPEIMHTIPCQNKDKCDWEGNKWIWAVSNAYGGDGLTIIQDHHLPKGVAKVDDPRYTLRPEAIESVFILYRITGDPSLRERAWKMFNSIIKSSITDIAHASLADCMVDKPPKSDRMESFWMAETLKYFFLIFSDFDVVSLDEYVLNTEAHPLRRPT